MDDIHRTIVREDGKERKKKNTAKHATGSN
jgi:hypothetical protein